MADSIESQYEQMQRAEQLTVYGEMAAGLAHDIKNPLSGIKAAMEILSKESTVSKEDKEVLVKVVGEIRRIESLIKQLFDYAKPPKPQFTILNFNELMEKTMGLLPKYPSFSLNDSRRITIVKDFDKSLPEIETDPMQQQQIFLNLLLNAGDAMPKGGTLTVKTSHDPTKDFIEIFVSDTGKGIDEDAMEKLFKPFYTTKSQGTGLGLATTKRLIEQQGGVIKATNHPSGGASFEIRLPTKQT